MSQKKPAKVEKTINEKNVIKKEPTPSNENDEDSSSDTSDSLYNSIKTAKSVTRKQTTKALSVKQKIRVPQLVVSPVEPPPLCTPVPASMPLKSMLSPVSATSTGSVTTATNISRFVQITTPDGQSYELLYPIYRSEYYVVFAVNDHAPHHKPYALKAELTKLREGETKRNSDLKNELIVLTKIGNIRQKMANWGKHFLEYVDCGSYKNFRFIVTTLCGPNLRVLRSFILKRNFTMSSALLINYNTFNAISDLHKLGYVHTAIRPSHFAVGSGTLSNIIYLIDFTRCFNPSSSSSIRNYVRRVNTREKLKFASRLMMDDKNMPTFQDDLESWVYMSIDIVNDSLLPWNSKMAVSKMLAAKVEFFYHLFSKELDACIPDEYRAIIDVLNTTHNRLLPKYERILSLLRQGLKHRNLDVENGDEQYRWQQYLDKKKLEQLNTPLYVASKMFSPRVTNSFLDMLFKDDLQSQDEGETNKRKKDQTTSLEQKDICQQQRTTEDKDDLFKQKGSTTTMTPTKKTASKEPRSTGGKGSQDKRQSKDKKALIGQPPKTVPSAESVAFGPTGSDGSSIPPSSDVQLSEPPAKELSSPLKPEEDEMLRRIEIVKEAQPLAKSIPVTKKMAGQSSDDRAKKPAPATKCVTRTAVPSPKVAAVVVNPSGKKKTSGDRGGATARK